MSLQTTQTTEENMTKTEKAKINTEQGIVNGVILKNQLEVMYEVFKYFKSIGEELTSIDFSQIVDIDERAMKSKYKLSEKGESIFRTKRHYLDLDGDCAEGTRFDTCYDDEDGILIHKSYKPTSKFIYGKDADEYELVSFRKNISDEVKLSTSDES